MRGFIKTEQEERDVCSRYRAGEDAYTIARDYGCSYIPVYACLKRNGVECRTNSEAHRVYRFDRTAFQQINTEPSAYWLGFLAADASIQSKRNGLFVNLSAKDKDHLDQFASFLKSDFPLYEYTANGYQLVRFSLFSKDILTALRRHGVSDHKTYALRWVPLEPPLQHHFLRGYFDGDGMFHVNKSSGHIACRFVGNADFVSSIRHYLATTIGLGSPRLLSANHNQQIVHLTYHGNRQVATIYRCLYQDSTIWLHRKRELARSHYTRFPKHAAGIASPS